MLRVFCTDDTAVALQQHVPAYIDWCTHAGIQASHIIHRLAPNILQLAVCYDNDRTYRFVFQNWCIMSSFSAFNVKAAACIACFWDAPLEETTKVQEVYQINGQVMRVAAAPLAMIPLGKFMCPSRQSPRSDHSAVQSLSY